MATIEFKNACYIKLGAAGVWEADSLETGKLRIGWKNQSLSDINSRNWERIGRQLGSEQPDRGAAARDLGALKMIATSGPDEVWITFSQGKLWWARLAGPVRGDKTSKFRRTARPWTDEAADGRKLFTTNLPGTISTVQGFRGTACRVKHPDVLRRLLNGISSPAAAAIRERSASLRDALVSAIKELHWKDFETLTDLVFRGAGWARVGLLGQHTKALDLELQEPIMGDRYVVQVKAQAGRSDLESFARELPQHVRRAFFVVHSPKSGLAASTMPRRVELVPPERLAELAIASGLGKWIEEKVR